MKICPRSWTDWRRTDMGKLAGALLKLFVAQDPKNCNDMFGGN